MKPVYLEFCGINSFSEPAKIDFRHLLDYGIFGIFGDTGSGKSTILDCIVFALYGKVSRLDAKEAVISNLINFGSDRAYVYFEFEIEYDKKRRLYRVERELKRKNSVQSVRVYECKGEGKDRVQTALAEGTRDGNDLLEKILGLEQRDFEKCIALPQGEFAQFVKSQRSDRLKLISRLFDLERYGEGMVKKINRRNAEAQRETEVLRARLEPYAAVTEEGIAELKREIKSLEAEEKKTAEALAAVRASERELSMLAEKRREFERAAREMERLEGIKAEMSALNDELSRLEKAANVTVCMKDARTAEERVAATKQAFARAQAEFTRAEKADKSAREWNAEGCAEEIEKLTALIAAAQTAERDEAAAKEYRAKLDSIGKEYEAESASFKGFDYLKERVAREERLAALGNGNFFAYAEEHGKAGLLRAEYAVFAEELAVLTEKYPQISADSKPLITKYKTLSAGEQTDFSKLKEEFEKTESARAALREELAELEKAKARFEMHIQTLNRLQTERQEWQARLDALLPRLKENAVSVEALNLKLAEKRAEQKKRTAEREEAAKAFSAAQIAFTRAEAEANAALDRQTETQARFKDALAAGGFTSGKEAAALTEKYGNSDRARERVEKYKEDYAAARRLLRELSKTDCSRATEEAVAAAKAKLKEAEEAEKELSQKTALKRESLARAESDILKKKELTAQYAEKRKESELCERLKKLLEGNKFMEFVAEEYLQTVAKNASARLLTLTDGRYFLRYDGGFVVGDNFNGGTPRGVFTLSGGETFLVSLSLALALSAEICQRSLRPIEFFFLDEGFGTLDEKLVDTVMDSLEKLKGEHFSIGIISHVEELRHRIGRKLSVKKATERHGSQITIE